MCGGELHSQGNAGTGVELLYFRTSAVAFSPLKLIWLFKSQDKHCGIQFEELLHELQGNLLKESTRHLEAENDCSCKRHKVGCLYDHKQSSSGIPKAGILLVHRTHHSEHNQLGSGQAVVQQRWRVETAAS